MLLVSWPLTVALLGPLDSSLQTLRLARICYDRFRCSCIKMRLWFELSPYMYYFYWVISMPVSLRALRTLILGLIDAVFGSFSGVSDCDIS